MSVPVVLPWLDLLRYVAAFMVAFAHARTLIFLRYSELDPDSQNLIVAVGFGVTRMGNEAVVLFFVLSGYLVGGRLWQRCKDGTFDARLYVIDRVSRIMLPLLVILVATLLLRWSIEKDWFWEEFLGNILSLQGITMPELGYNHPLWSLPYEVWCYVMALGVGLLWNGRWPLGLSMIAAAAFLFMVYLVPWYAVVWLMGAIIYQWRDRFRSVWLLVLGLVFAVYGMVSFQFADGLLPDSWFASSAWVLGYYTSSLLLGVGFSLVVHQLAQMPPKSNMSIRLNRVGHWLAASSYSLYLSHFVVLQALDWTLLEPDPYVTPSNLFTLFWVLVLCQAVAIAIYFVSEKHTNLARSWLKRLFPAKSTPLSRREAVAQKH